MAIDIQWGTGVIVIPRADMPLIQTTPVEVRELNLTTLHLILRDLEDDFIGMAYSSTHKYSGPVTISGVELALVMEILEPYTLTFEDGQYAVNITGGNSNVADRVNINNVGLRTANSAGLVQSSEIQFSSYQNVVTIDQANGTAGQVYPLGTVQSPVNNLTDAKFIANLRGLDAISVKGNFTFLETDTLNNFTVIGQAPRKTTITLTDAATITNCTFENATVTGTLDGGVDINHCHIGALTYVDGALHDCELQAAPIVLSGVKADFIRCWSGVAGGGSYAHIDMNGGGTDLLIRDFHGGLTLQNHTAGEDAVSVDMSSGQLILDNTITAGTFTIRGVCKVIDNSGPGATIILEGIDGTKVNETWRRLGLDPAAPLTNKPDGGISATDITILATESGADIIQTRQ